MPMTGLHPDVLPVKLSNLPHMRAGFSLTTCYNPQGFVATNTFAFKQIGPTQADICHYGEYYVRFVLSEPS